MRPRLGKRTCRRGPRKGVPIGGGGAGTQPAPKVIMTDASSHQPWKPHQPPSHDSSRVGASCLHSRLAPAWQPCISSRASAPTKTGSTSNSAVKDSTQSPTVQEQRPTEYDLQLLHDSSDPPVWSSPSSGESPHRSDFAAVENGATAGGVFTLHIPTDTQTTQHQTFHPSHSESRFYPPPPPPERSSSPTKLRHRISH